jgi:2-polyprenyl-3-methyl-5-hydroxy-6-metoxy-1,4-benzoquinol methylase
LTALVRSEEWDRRYADREFLWTVEPNRFVVRELAGIPPGRALDLACGEGRNAVWLAEQGWHVTAVDFSRVGLDKARGLAAAHHVTVEWVAADLLSYEPRVGAYELVLLAYLHIAPDDLAVVLRRACSALKPRGEILVIGHDLTNLIEGVGGPQDPALLYTPATIAAELAGLLVQRAERVRRPVDVDGKIEHAIDTLVRASRL